MKKALVLLLVGMLVFSNFSYAATPDHDEMTYTNFGNALDANEMDYVDIHGLVKEMKNGDLKRLESITWYSDHMPTQTSETDAFDATPVEMGKYKITYTIKYFDKDYDEAWDYNADVIYKEVYYEWTEWNDGVPETVSEYFIKTMWSDQWELYIPGMGENPLMKTEK